MVCDWFPFSVQLAHRLANKSPEAESRVIP